MNILVTGAEGFLGSRLTGRLTGRLKPRTTVFGLCHDRMADYRPQVVSVRGDVTDLARILDIIVNCEIDQIYHLAAKSIVRNCVNDPLGCFGTNVLGTAVLLEAARQSGRVKGIVVMESDKSYGAGPIPYVETQALNPGGVYESSKAAAGMVARAYYHNYGLPVFTVRSANVYGPNDRNLSRLVPNTITRILTGKKPQITEGADKYVREFIFADDVCECLEHLMNVGPWGEAINIGSGESSTVGALIAMICELLGVPANTDVWPRPQRLTEIATQMLDVSKLRHLFCDFRPTRLREGLQLTVNWYKAHPLCPN